MNVIKQKATSKELQTQLMKVTGEIEAMQTEINNKKAQLQQKAKIADTLKQQLEKLNTSGPVKVSEHAMLRYLERVKAVDIAKISADILTQDVLGMISALGNGKYPHKDGFMLVVKDNTVITIHKP